MACAKELEEKFPFMDMKRVGMWGNSGGGYGTVSAMLLYPDFYKAGVASSGNYDQRMYEHSWTERYNGLYDPEVYELNKYNKDYDLMVLPRMNHNVPSDLYFIRRKMDFFVRYLLGEEPPSEFKFVCM